MPELAKAIRSVLLLKYVQAPFRTWPKLRILILIIGLIAIPIWQASFLNARDDLDVERTSARAVVRADRIGDIKRHYVTLQCCVFDKYMLTRSARQFYSDALLFLAKHSAKHKGECQIVHRIDLEVTDVCRDLDVADIVPYSQYASCSPDGTAGSACRRQP